MDANTIRKAQQELSNPSSPFYIGNGSSFSRLNNYLNGYGYGNFRGGINTNYFGANKKMYLAPPSTDKFELYHKAVAQNQTKKWIAGGLAAVAGFFLLRGKIPFIGKFLKKL